MGHPALDHESLFLKYSHILGPCKHTLCLVPRKPHVNLFIAKYYYLISKHIYKERPLNLIVCLDKFNFHNLN
jgi:hypothetical protein